MSSPRSSIIRFLKPKYAPTNVNGKEIPNHKNSKAIKVVNGTAAELPFPQSIKLSKKNMENTIPGHKTLDASTEINEKLIVNEIDETVFSKKCPSELIDVKDEDIVIWVDPLDGTTEYAKGILDCVTVLIGIAVNGKAIAGVIHQPYYNYKIENDESKIGRTIWGLVGLGAFGYKNLQKTQAEIENDMLNRNLTFGKNNNFIIASSKSHRNKQLDKALESLKPSQIINAGGAGYKSLLVLEGQADTYLYPSPGCKKWDTCAPEAIINSVGGKLTNIMGESYDYKKDVMYNNSTGVLACRSEVLHNWVVNNIPKEVKKSLTSQL
ncbi:hypothetical protein RND71_043578 [Anisodus tanguticus]|uniref:3'(2'),5'-bisphosphate nucleotidase 1 n=1 Tax=Anisodus tanguticus TaxID=243964 RepID=A0AAE1QPA7_9SOLA|nr:hypothetical protein RND71_043578 [Anisodus tanguticus]